MADPKTTNIGLFKPANGADVDTWDVPVNANSDTLDSMAGGVTTLNVTGQSGTVALTSTQYVPRIWKITGTLTANVTYQLPTGVGGTWSVGNASTGAFTVTLASAGGGTTMAIPQGERLMLSSDATDVFLTDLQAYVPIPIAQFRNVTTGSLILNAPNIYTQLPLDTTIVNTITGASISSGNVILGAGTYRATANIPTQLANTNAYNWRVRLYNVTDFTNALLGPVGFANLGTFSGQVPGVGILDGYFTLTGTKTIQLSMFTSTGAPGQITVGQAPQDGFPNDYYDLVLQQIV